MSAVKGIYIESVGAYLPDHREKLVDVVATLDDTEAARVSAAGYDTVSVEEELYPGDMALAAARDALDRGGISAASLSMISVSSIHRNGHKRLWSPASYVQVALGNSTAVPFNLMQGCNGNLIALQLACNHLAVGGADERAMVLATDNFGTSSFNRYLSDYGIVYGDAAGAVVLSRRPSALRVVALHTVSDPELEGLHRTEQPLPEAAELLPDEHDVRAAKRAYLGRHGKESLSVRTRAAVQEIKDALLPGDAESGVRHIVFPNLGYELLLGNYFPVFDNGLEKSLWDEVGSKVGHLGSGDAVIGLHHLVSNGLLDEGDKVLLLGAGAGFTWTGALIEVVDRV